ncbi:nucleoside transporter [Salmonella enterica]
MKDGIYAVVFESSQSSFGEGIAVVRGGYVHGGDMGFICRGKVESGMLELEVEQYNSEIPSALGMEGVYMLEMNYRDVGEGVYRFRGHVKGDPERRLTARAFHLGGLLEENS